jgi:hypothetical protein
MLHSVWRFFGASLGSRAGFASAHKPPTQMPNCPVCGGADGEGSPVADDAGGVEYMLLVAMESLYSGNPERDVQLGVLRVLLNVLQVGMSCRLVNMAVPGTVVVAVQQLSLCC